MTRYGGNTCQYMLDMSRSCLTSTNTGASKCARQRLHHRRLRHTSHAQTRIAYIKDICPNLKGVRRTNCDMHPPEADIL